MDRRKAIKSIALTFGSVVATPTLINILASCSNKETTTNYLFLNANQSNIIHQLVQVILPETHFAGVKNMHLTQFTDQMFFYTVSKEDQAQFNQGAKHFEHVFLTTYNKNASDGSLKEFEQLFKTYFDVSNTKEASVFELINKDEQELDTNETSEYFIYQFLTTIRYYALFGYCTSEVFISEKPS